MNEASWCFCLILAIRVTVTAPALQSTSQGLGWGESCLLVQGSPHPPSSPLPTPPFAFGGREVFAALWGLGTLPGGGGLGSEGRERPLRRTGGLGGSPRHCILRC